MALEMMEPDAVRVIEAIQGVQKLYRFPNGYGASVVKGEHTYGGDEGLWELAVLTFMDKDGTTLDDYDFEICYTTPIAEDVLGHLTDEEVEINLRKIKELP
jgi:hypothetical protein